jgi:hypothetical protein
VTLDGFNALVLGLALGCLGRRWRRLAKDVVDALFKVGILVGAHCGGLKWAVRWRLRQGESKMRLLPHRIFFSFAKVILHSHPRHTTSTSTETISHRQAQYRYRNRQIDR